MSFNHLNYFSYFKVLLPHPDPKDPDEGSIRIK